MDSVLSFVFEKTERVPGLVAEITDSEEKKESSAACSLGESHSGRSDFSVRLPILSRRPAEAARGKFLVLVILRPTLPSWCWPEPVLTMSTEKERANTEEHMLNDSHSGEKNLQQELEQKTRSSKETDPGLSTNQPKVTEPTTAGSSPITPDTASEAPNILGVAVVDFVCERLTQNHLVGPQLEYSYPASLLENAELCTQLPFLALPDGSHLVCGLANSV